MNNEELVELAEKIATEAHEGQFRKCGIIPYIEHPRAVVGRVGSDPFSKIVAWLHDVIEDTNVSSDELLERGIPRECVNAVVLLTKTDGKDYEGYLERVASSSLATKVKIADMISNIADNPSPKQIKKYAEGLVRLTR